MKRWYTEQKATVKRGIWLCTSLALSFLSSFKVSTVHFKCVRRPLESRRKVCVQLHICPLVNKFSLSVMLHVNKFSLPVMLHVNKFSLPVMFAYKQVLLYLHVACK